MEWNSACLITVVVGWHTILGHKTRLYWNEWVRQNSRTEFKSYNKISCYVCYKNRSENYLHIESNELTAAAIKTTIGYFIRTETQKPWDPRFSKISGALIFCQMQSFHGGWSILTHELQGRTWRVWTSSQWREWRSLYLSSLSRLFPRAETEKENLSLASVL